MRFAAALVLLAACAPSTPPDPEIERQREIAALVAKLGDPGAEHALATHADEAVLKLLAVLREDPSPERRGRAAAVLGRIRRMTGNPTILGAYADALRDTPSAVIVRELLRHAHLFDDAEGSVKTLLLAYLEKMAGVPVDLVRAAAVMTETDAMRAMTTHIARLREAGPDEGRDLAVRYLGRAARWGRRDAAEYLVNCTTAGGDALALAAERELELIAGRARPKNWRGWWLEHAGEEREDWIAASIAVERQAPFDVAKPEDWDWLLGTLATPTDREPEFALIRRHLGVRAGYRSPRDVFDPEASTESITEGNARAIELVKRWWTERRDALVWNAAERRFDAVKRSNGEDLEKPVREKLAAADFGGALGAAARGGEEMLAAWRERIVTAGREYVARELARAKGLPAAEAKALREDLAARFANLQDFAAEQEAIRRASD